MSARPEPSYGSPTRALPPEMETVSALKAPSFTGPSSSAACRHPVAVMAKTTAEVPPVTTAVFPETAT